ncbi:hypothetical protein FRC02_000259 [Tulasnella sp. 418]|nr:hypothetical protein FRC02_000259 [Tulasnella sp. 418]
MSIHSQSSSSRATRPPFRYLHTDFSTPEKPTSSDFPMDEKAAYRSHPSAFTLGRQETVIPSQESRQETCRSPFDARSRPPTRHQTLSLSTSHSTPSHCHPPYSQSSLYTPHHSTQDEALSSFDVGLAPRVKRWLPLGLWILTTIGFFVAIGWWRTEVFDGLEQLSNWIREQGYQGQAILFFLIFLTTFPPMPLYSTLIMLSGYCLGAYQGAVISYFAALSGAIAVFLLSRAYFRSCINDMIVNAPVSVKRAIRVVEKQPKLLFLIRLSPYPYNLMNALLASSRISFTTYTSCTALSLFKVLIHTTIGASIHKFSDYHTHSGKGDNSATEDSESDTNFMNRVWTIVGVVMCVALLVYLSWVARKAVNDADDEDEYGLPVAHRVGRNSRSRNNVPVMGETDEGESVAFLSPMAQDDSRRPSFDYARSTHVQEMVQSPFRPVSPMRSLPSSPLRVNADLSR